MSCRDNQGHLLLYFSKTIIVCYLAETVKVICFFCFKDYQSLLSCRDNQGHLLLLFLRLLEFSLPFQRLPESFVLQRLSMSSALYFSKTIRVFCVVETFNVICPFTLQDYHSLLYASKTSMSFVKTITVFFTFTRLSQSSLRFQDYQSLLFQEYHSLLYFSKTIRVFLSQDYHSLLYFSKTIKVCCLVETINVFCSLHFQRSSESFVSKAIRVFCRDFNFSFTFQNFKVFCLMYLIRLTFFLFTSFDSWVSANGQSDGKIARMKLCPYLYLPFHFQ